MTLSSLVAPAIILTLVIRVNSDPLQVRRNFLHLDTRPHLEQTHDTAGFSPGFRRTACRPRYKIPPRGFMRMLRLTLAVVLAAIGAATAQAQAAWPQWGQNAQHSGFLPVAGQSLQGKLSDQVFDP